MSLTRWSPWEDLARLREDLNRFLETSPMPSIFRGEGWQPNVDLLEEGNDLVVRADLPGFNPEEVEVRVFPDSITLRGETREEERMDQPGYHRRERRIGSFYRQIRLPAQVVPEDARATFKQGVIEVHMPKANGRGGNGFKVDIAKE